MIPSLYFLSILNIKTIKAVSCTPDQNLWQEIVHLIAFLLQIFASQIFFHQLWIADFP